MFVYFLSVFKSVPLICVSWSLTGREVCSGELLKIKIKYIIYIINIGLTGLSQIKFFRNILNQYL